MDKCPGTAVDHIEPIIRWVKSDTCWDGAPGTDATAQVKTQGIGHVSNGKLQLHDSVAAYDDITCIGRAGDLKRHRASQALRAMPALATYRFGVWCRKQPTPVRQLSGVVYRAALLASETVSGIYLDSATEVGDDLHLIHAGGINIHPASRIGDRVGLMHGVTLAADERGAPVLGDDVFIGAYVLGDGAIDIDPAD